MIARAASVLVVEDEALIRLMLVDILEQGLGHRVIAEAGSVAEGKSLVENENSEFDLAILDINLQGWSVLPVAQALDKRGVPFLFVSGYKRRDLPAEFGDRLLVQKPIEISNLKAAIGIVLAAQNPS